MVTRIRVPPGLAVEAGEYRAEDLGPVWDDVRGAEGVQIECPRHPDTWWPTKGRDLPLTELKTWRCPKCVWAFREGLKGSGGTPQF